MIEVLLRPLADAFMQVGVFVALLVAPFGWARYRWGRQLDAALVRYRRLGPLVAAALTTPPGCGGAIVVVALYSRGAVSYGAAVAALVATMGDATWLLLASDPVLTLQLKLLLLVVGATTGYVVDALGIAPRLRRMEGATDEADHGLPVERPSGSAGRRTGGVALLDRSGRASVRPAAPAGPTGPTGPIGPIGALPVLVWATLAVAATIAVPTTFRVFDPAVVGQSLFGGLDPYLALGVLGTAVCLMTFVRGGCKLAADDARTAHPSSGSEVLRQGGQEVAFITVWVAAAYVAWAALSHLTGFDGSQLPLHGLLGVVVGAMVGLIPGCGVQIVFTGIFLAGGMPLSTLVANSVSQDGDALLPLLAVEHRSALLATVLTTVPALLVGTVLLLARP